MAGTRRERLTVEVDSKLRNSLSRWGSRGGKPAAPLGVCRQWRLRPGRGDVWRGEPQSPV
jgi:hypothetical protein